MIHFELAQVLSLLIGIVLPVLTGLVTKWQTAPGVRAMVLLGLSAVTSFLSEFLSSVTGGTTFDVGATLLAVLGTFIVGVGTQYGLWRPTGVSDAAKRVGSGPVA